MNAVLLQLLLPPITMAAPWLIPAWRRQWPRFWVTLLVWSVGWATTLVLWAGPGLLLLLCLGLFTAWTTHIPLSKT